MTPDQERNRTETLGIYRLLFETWRFQVDSGWHRTNYFAAFETALLLGVGKVILDGCNNFLGIIACAFGLALTGVWIRNDQKVQSYIDYWWAAIQQIEKESLTSDSTSNTKSDLPKWNFASKYDNNAAELYKIHRVDWPSYRWLMRLVPSLFFIAWLCLTCLALSATYPHGHDYKLRITIMNWQAIGSCATALGVIFVGWQIWLSKRQSITAFEDGLSHQYREILKTIPVKALLGQTLTPDEFSKCMDGIYHYLDLSNEQVFLRRSGRISAKTWVNWSDGMKLNLSRQAFAEVWKMVKSQAAGSLSELRKLEDSEFKDDPKHW